MSGQTEELLDDIVIPKKRNDGGTLKDRMSENAWNDLMPARYIRNDVNGEPAESHEEVFERVAKNIALADVVYADYEVTVTPDQIKQNHSKRDELAAEVFGEGVTVEDDVTTKLTQENVYNFSYDSVVPELPDELAAEVEETKDEFESQMSHLNFMPNTPTIMNAGGELQQLSACFVLSPEDDMDDIHEKVKHAASIFQSGGGCGYGFWKLRPFGDPVGSSGGISSGPMRFMETFDQMCGTVAQGGTRRGAQMGIMRISHPDVIAFIHAKNKDVSLARTLLLNDPDDYTHDSFNEALEEARGLITVDEDGNERVPEHLRNAVEGHLSNFNISVGVTDEFMDAVQNNEEYTFTNPRTGEPHIASEETKEMYSWFGLEEYVTVGEELSIPAQILWRDMINGAHENGEPGVVFLERANKEHSFDTEEHPDHQIYATNPCVTGDTRIATSNGLLTAEELYKTGTATEVTVAESLDTTETLKEASSVFKTGEKETVTVTTEEGYELQLTPDHQLYTDAEEWVEAGNLTDGDTIQLLDRHGVFGSYGNGADGITTGILSELNDPDITEVSYEVPVSEVTHIAPEPALNLYETLFDGEQQVQKQSVRMSEIAEAAIENEILLESQTVPDVVYTGSKQFVSGYLQAFFSIKGDIVDKESELPYVSVRDTSYEKLQEIQQLLLNFNIESELLSGEVHKDSWFIEIHGESVVTFAEEIGFMESIVESPKSRYKQDRLDSCVSTYRTELMEQSDSHTATVSSVEPAGVEPVYDLVEPDTHSFIANGIVSHNCGEQPLEEYEACNLGHINLSTLARKDAPDWRVWWSENQSEYTDMEDAMEDYFREAIDIDEFDTRIKTGTHFLENVVTMSDFPIDKISEKVRDMRKIGLGIMGLAQLYIQLGFEYGQDPSNEFSRVLMKYINHTSKQVSHELAAERGPFNDWEDSKYATPTEYPDWFRKQTGEDPQDWESGYPIRNHNTTTIAPTGSTSMLGNTTGGCEPIYNVAYYKNVSGDVQGDEMLVEFDDYFLRVLEANDIDVEAVKEEAAQQMDSNEFTGVSGLDTVPTEIGDLFVVTSDLTGLEHASVQCALQDGVDSSISKTVNFPNSATVEDMREVYEYVYANGGKGVTVYRDGTRSKQVLTTRSDNTEFSDETALLDAVEDAAETSEGFRTELSQILLDTLDEKSTETVGFTEFVDNLAEDMNISHGDAKKLSISEYRKRPDNLVGATVRVTTGYGTLYVVLNEDTNGDLFEIFCEIGKSGGYTQSFTESLSRMVSMSLRYGVPPERVIKHLEGIRSPKVGWDDEEQINSIPDGIATAMKRYIEYGGVIGLIKAQRNGELEQIEDGPENIENGHKTETGTEYEKSSGTIDLPECPNCGSSDLYYSEGCKTCESCGWSEC